MFCRLRLSLTGSFNLQYIDTIKMNYKEKLQQTNSIIWELDNEVRKKGGEVKQTIEPKKYKQPKREYEQNVKIINSYKRQLKKLK